MSQVKEDLICEIIRLSQTNLLDKKCANQNSEKQEQIAVDWIRKNAAEYRTNFQSRLDIFPASLFGDIPAKKRLSDAYIFPTPTTTLLSIMKDFMFLDFPIEELNSESLLNS